MYHEHLLPKETAPTPEQLAKLASSAMATARALDRMRPVRIKERANSFINDIDFVNADDEGISTENHRMAFRVARRVRQVQAETDIEPYTIPIDEWNMQIFDTRWYRSDLASAIGSRSVYYFEWGTDRAFRAEKQTRVVPYSPEGDTLDATLESVVSRGVLIDPDIVHAEGEYRQVTRDDVAYLNDDLQGYFQTITARAS